MDKIHVARLEPQIQIQWAKSWALSYSRVVLFMPATCLFPTKKAEMLRSLLGLRDSVFTEHYSIASEKWNSKHICFIVGWYPGTHLVDSSLLPSYSTSHMFGVLLEFMGSLGLSTVIWNCNFRWAASVLHSNTKNSRCLTQSMKETQSYFQGSEWMLIFLLAGKIFIVTFVFSRLCYYPKSGAGYLWHKLCPSTPLLSDLGLAAPF